ncbi:hypothetical protein TNCV_1368231 [Trichonephila clavipes]|nr:hypothetical protein TNCV_1368231 [Trichonephila clavipes]
MIVLSVLSNCPAVYLFTADYRTITGCDIKKRAKSSESDGCGVLVKRVPQTVLVVQPSIAINLMPISDDMLTRKEFFESSP